MTLSSGSDRPQNELYRSESTRSAARLPSHMSRPKLSVVVPVFNEEATLEAFFTRLRAVLEQLEGAGATWEVVFVDDGSNDGSGEILTAKAGSDARIKLLTFSRNFGHQAALTAGLDRAAGDFVVLIDADLQDPPEVIVRMLAQAREGYDVVYGQRSKRRGDSLFKRLTAAVFYRGLRLITGVEIPVDTGDFRLMSRQVVLTLRSLRERHRFVRGLIAWVGFRQSAVTYDRDPRFAGETKYPIERMLRFAVDGATSFSIVPLRMATWLGLTTGLVATLGGLTAAFIKLFAPQVVLPGWTGLMVAVAFGFSVQLTITGILGEYVGRIYEELKRRPLYVTARELNFEDDAELRPSQTPAPSPDRVRP